MATVTKTFTENQYSSWKATWTVTIIGTDTTVGSSSTFTVPNPTVKAKYSASNKGYACVTINLHKPGGEEWDYVSYKRRSSSDYHVSWASGTEYTLGVTGSFGSFDVSRYFNANNKTSRTAAFSVTSDPYGITLQSAKDANGSSNENWYDNLDTYNWGTILTLTLDAPPNLSSVTKTSTSNGRGYYWKDISTASVTVYDSWVQYGGEITSATLTIGEQSVTSTSSGKLSIKVNTAGTFTPVLSVTDSRGQTTTKNLTDITVQEFQSTTATWGTIQSDTNGYYANVSTASLTVSDITVMEGFSVTSVKLTIGSQSQSVTTLTNDSASFSIPLNAVGTFTPNVKIYTTADVYSTNTYSSITVGEYTKPNVSFQTYRAKNEPDTNPTKFGIKDEEGEEVLIEATFNYLSDICELVEPTVTVTDENGDTYSAVITWYTTYSETNGVSSAVNWTNYNPTSPVTLYGLATGYGSTTGFSDGDAFQVTITPEDSFGQGNSITNAVSSSYFTIDFQAGGKEICFGGPANDANVLTNHPKGLFKCKMDTEFNDMTSTEVDNFISDLDISGSGINLTQADWIVEQGIDGIWTWRKWESGIAECWGDTGSVTLSSYGTALGGQAYTTTVTFPTGLFVATPLVTFSAYINNAWALCGTTVLNNRSATTYGLYALSTTGTTTNTPTEWWVEAKGRWK